MVQYLQEQISEKGGELQRFLSEMTSVEPVPLAGKTRPLWFEAVRNSEVSEENQQPLTVI